MAVEDLNARPFRNIAEISADSADDYDIVGDDISDIDSAPDTDIANDGTYPAVGSTPGSGIDNLELGDAGVDGDEDDADIADVEVSVVYDLSLVKVLPTGQRYRLGDVVRFEIEVENLGNVDSGPVTVADVIPPGMSFISASDGGVASVGRVTWTIANLEPGETTVLTIGLRFDNVGLAQYVNTAEITVDSATLYDTVSQNDGNDRDTADIPTADVLRDNPPPRRLPVSGGDAGAVLTLAALLVGIGLFLHGFRRRRRLI